MNLVPIDRARSLLWNVASLYEGGTAMIASALARLSADQPLPTTRQDADGSACYSYPREEHMQAFLQSGGRLYAETDYRETFRNYDVPDQITAGLLRSTDAANIPFRDEQACEKP